MGKGESRYHQNLSIMNSRFTKNNLRHRSTGTNPGLNDNYFAMGYASQQTSKVKIREETPIPSSLAELHA